MPSPRLSQAVADGLIALPESGPVVVFNPPGAADLSMLDPARTTLIQTNVIDHEHLRQRGFQVQSELAPEARFAAAIVALPRARDLARDMVARAARASTGPVLVDGQKTDGIDAMARALRKLAPEAQVWSKAHGKLIWFAGADLSGWLARPRRLPDGMITRPGVFSADGPDKGSQALARALPESLSGRGADLGAGWGWLARAVLARPAVSHLDLVEADATALACARDNIADPRAAFHWADATGWGAGAGLDFIVMNPPFHTGRKGDPGLGRAFIRAAARALAPQGQLWLVANRHLPYEDELTAHFRDVAEMQGSAGFKVLRALKPRGKPRPVA